MSNYAGDTLKMHEVSISSTPLSESDAKFPAVESGSSGSYLDKSICGSPTVIRATELSQTESEKQGVEGSADQNNPVSEGIDGGANKFQSVSPDSKENDASKGDKNFTFEVSPLPDSSGREPGKNWQPFPTIQATTASPVNFLVIFVRKCVTLPVVTLSAWCFVSLIFSYVARIFLLLIFFLNFWWFYGVIILSLMLLF